jgi:FixJ family two-component response regulator
MVERLQAMPAQRTNVFIIDDESSIRTALERLCRAAGHTGRAFESVDEFLAATVDDHAACVVTDIRMPGVSALELPSRLRALHRNLPVIFITAFDTPETRAEARAAGAAGYFRKPVDDQALLDAIEWSLSQDPIPNHQ